MADGGGSVDSGASSWWGGWLETAKQKGAAALEMVAKDLAEFSNTMQKDTGHAVEVTSSTLKDSLKAENTSAAKDKVAKGLNTFLESVSRALTVPPDDDDEIPITSTTSPEDMFDRQKARLHAVQVDPGTYINEPSGPPEAYSMWCQGFDLDAVKGEISELLVSKVEVRGLYTKLVPNQVSHVEFWRRYFYKLHQIEVDQARKEALMKRAEKARAEDSLSWEDDWSGDEDDNASDWERLPRPSREETKSSTTAESKSSTTQAASAVSTTSTDVPSSQPAGSKGVSPLSSVLSSTQLSGGQSEAQKVDVPSAEQGDSRLSQPVPVSPQEERLSQPVQEQSSAVGDSGAQQAADRTEDQAAASNLQQADPSELADTTKSHEITETDRPDEQLSTETKTVAQLSTDTSNISAEKADHLEPASDTGQVTESGVSSPKSSPTSLKSSPIDIQRGGAGASSPPTSLSPTQKSPAAGGSETRASNTSVQSEPAVPSADLQKETAVSRQPEGQQTLAVDVGEQEDRRLKTVDKGDIVVVGSDHGSPLSTASDSKDLEDWEQDLDVELTEEDMKAAEELAKSLGQDLNLDDDWESWE